ncbi:MAG: metallophosphoesterase, partial [Oricola sp.]|nr:metallophosphoesterase [Oricola sp.]
MTGLGALEVLKLAIYYGSWLYFPAAAALFWLIAGKQGAVRLAAAVGLIVASLVAYGRFVEPRILLTAEHDITLEACAPQAGEVRLAVVSDIHAGLFGNAMPVSRIARRIEAADVDATLIAGDFIYFLHPDKMEETFAAFRTVSTPVYAVLGNHDIGRPGPDLGEALREHLPSAGIMIVDNRTVLLEGERIDLELVGLSDLWGREQQLSLLNTDARRPRIVLTHNPATIYDLRPGMSADLLIGGHTHGGQIKIPFLTCALTGVCAENDYGLRNQSGMPVFTTSGTGMVGLPMRFRVPPRIDILNLGYSSC